jgi:hypothetical protein
MGAKAGDEQFNSSTPSNDIKMGSISNQTGIYDEKIFSDIQ